MSAVASRRSHHRGDSMRRLITALLLTLIASLGSRAARAQDAARTTAPTASVARPGDVASEDAIIAALYGAISGPAGQKRDWDRFRPLFIPDARLVFARPRRPE